MTQAEQVEQSQQTLALQSKTKLLLDNINGAMVGLDKANWLCTRLTYVPT